MANQNLGKEVFSRTYDPAFTDGLGHRVPTTGTWALSVQQESLPRVSVNVGYFRNWWGNWYAVDNRATTPADYTPFSITAPVDARLPNGGGHIDQRPVQSRAGARSAQVDELAQPSEQLREADRELAGRGRQHYRAAAERADAAGRHEHRAPARGRLRDKAALPEQERARAARPPRSRAARPLNPYCRVDEPYRTDIRGLATYTIPRIDVQVSGTWRNDAGPELAANYTVTSAVAAPSLGRDLSAGNVTVNLIEPGTFYADRSNNIDLRVAKILRFGRTRAQIGFDIYNLTNTDVVTGVQPDVRADERLVADADIDSAGAIREDQRAVRLLTTWARALDRPEPGAWSRTRAGPVLARGRAFVCFSPSKFSVNFA